MKRATEQDFKGTALKVLNAVKEVVTPSTLSEAKFTLEAEPKDKWFRIISRDQFFGMACKVHQSVFTFLSGFSYSFGLYGGSWTAEKGDTVILEFSDGCLILDVFLKG